MASIINEFKSTSSHGSKKHQRSIPTAQASSLISAIVSQEIIPINSGIITNKKEKKKLSDLALDSLDLNTENIKENVNYEIQDYKNSEQEDEQENEQEEQQDKIKERKRHKKINRGSISSNLKRKS
ncbi:452_t:CDS:1 [Cetraspora pellucida]|uniref:452_t:CDS:1 n=1 Tax=Cetraspora pellucida TaxID=1433469 RepID=A0ACA9KQD0_9GLOM|nr:452_t:CDS:1 [Cetraspora pellucida]